MTFMNRTGGVARMSPIRLDRLERPLLLRAGDVEIFAVPCDAEMQPRGRRHFLGVVEAGNRLLPTPSRIEGGSALHLLAIPGASAELVAVEVAPPDVEGGVDSTEVAWRAFLARAVGLDRDDTVAVTIDAGLARLQARIDEAGAREDARLSGMIERDRAIGAEAGHRLAGSVGRERRPAADAPAMASRRLHLLRATELVFRHRGIEPAISAGALDAGALGAGALDAGDVETLARRAGARCRRIAIDDGLLSGDAGAILAFTGDAGQPVALLPAGGGYRLVDPASGSGWKADAGVLAGLAPMGYTFYLGLPARALRARDLAVAVLAGDRSDLRTLAAMAALGGLLGLAVPLATRFLFDSVIPEGERGQLLTVGLGLVLLALGSTVFRAAQEVARLRVDGKSRIALQAGLWGRLVQLPAGFFRRFAPGDLAERLDGLDDLREAVLGVVLGSGLGVLLALVGAGMMLWLDSTLALAVMPMALALVLVTGLSGCLQIRWQRRVATLDGRLAACVLETFAGIRKLRLAAAETRAYGRWAALFGERRAALLAAGRLSNRFTVFQTLLDTATLMLIFWAAVEVSGRGAGPGDGGIASPGLFLAFLSAFATFQQALMSVAGGALELAQSWPRLERARPILEALPESRAGLMQPGRLEGGIEVVDLRFAYAEGSSAAEVLQGAQVLKGLSLEIRPKELVAIVGASGSGKSTLLRCLLGFERPTSGAIYLDGKDLRHLDPQAVRRQLGVVLQDDRLFPGSILDNIRGPHDVDLDAVRLAASRAAILDDIESWPMGFHTMVAEGAGTLSGGQRQRLLLARALVAEPRILLLDEATSALDNPSQAVITRHLRALDATRIVIAHRLSTIRDADRILVIEDGRIVESGTFDELIASRGRLHALARRQAES